jgi:hypothetical protein
MKLEVGKTYLTRNGEDDLVAIDLTKFPINNVVNPFTLVKLLTYEEAEKLIEEKIS